MKKQQKISKVIKLMQFPCFDALSYAHLAEGRLDVVLQCANKIWDIHPIIPIIKAEMSKVTSSEFHSFSIPLTVDINSGENWGLVH